MRRRRSAAAAGVVFLSLTIGCDRNQQREADLKAQQAREKARELGTKAAAEAKKAAGAIDSAVHSGTDGVSVSTAGADEKLRSGARDLERAGDDAAAKLKGAALITTVKSALANQVGFKTLGSIDVTVDGQVVTLSGTVTSPERKQEAEQAAAGVDGVSTVVNHLQVQ